MSRKGALEKGEPWCTESAGRHLCPVRRARRAAARAGSTGLLGGEQATPSAPTSHHLLQAALVPSIGGHMDHEASWINQGVVSRGRT